MKKENYLSPRIKVFHVHSISLCATSTLTGVKHEGFSEEQGGSWVGPFTGKAFSGHEGFTEDNSGSWE